jgi:HEAT repeat protein
MNSKLWKHYTPLALALLLGLTGCSRTVEDVAKWETAGNIKKLVAALQDPKVEVRIAAAESLGNLKAEPAVDALAALFNDADEDAQAASVKALAAIGSDSTVTPLIAALKLDPAEARRTAAAGLGTLNAESAVVPLAELLDDPDEQLQTIAATAIGNIGSESGSAPLGVRFASAPDGLKLVIIDALSITAGDDGITALIEAMGDDSVKVRDAAKKALVVVGKPAVPALLMALRHENKSVRRGTLGALRGLASTPKDGEHQIWYWLARVSTDNQPGIDTKTVENLAAKGPDAIGTLLDAVSHPDDEIRAHAFLALEMIGDASREPAMAKVGEEANADAKAWFGNRNAWHGAPSDYIDLWAALAALNPGFKTDAAKIATLQAKARPAFNIITTPDFEATHAYVPYLIGLLGDDTEPPPEQPDYDADGVPIVKQKVDRFHGKANQEIARGKLIEVGQLAALPLLATLSDNNALIAGHAAIILGGLKDTRATQPLIGILERRLEAGEQLSNSPFYIALQHLKAPEAEPVLKRIRPNPDRAIYVFGGQYRDIKVISAETSDTGADPELPIEFRMGYIEKGKVGEYTIRFVKDNQGNWLPSPALPHHLP